jgi:hypothetical protein
VNYDDPTDNGNPSGAPDDNPPAGVRRLPAKAATFNPAATYTKAASLAVTAKKAGQPVPYVHSPGLRLVPARSRLRSRARRLPYVNSPGANPASAKKTTTAAAKIVAAAKKKGGK